MDVTTQPPDYLRPYRRAVQRHGAGFSALLWASPDTQAARFEALVRLYDFADKRILDAGCGRADFLDYLRAREVFPADYVGLEALAEFAAAASAKGWQNAQIVQADFVRQPQRLCTGSDAIVFCGSLNTLDRGAFHATLKTAYAAAGEAVVFNFLSSPLLAAAPWLTWHRPAEVESFAASLGARFEKLDDYMEGDCSFVLWKKEITAETLSAETRVVGYPG